MLRRTMLFIPGNNPGMLQSASILGADSIIFDLEDAVSPSEKDSARILVREAIKHLNHKPCEITVRVNPLTTPFGMKDIVEIAKVKPDALLIPKAEEDQMIEISETLSRVESECGYEDGAIKLIPLVESAYGVEKVYDIIKSSTRTVAVLFGGEDYTADMGIKRTKVGEEIFYARNRVAVACRAAKVDSIDTPFTDTNDMDGLIIDTEKAKSLGFTGKAVINPRQVDYIHQVLAPETKDIEYAERVLEAMAVAESEGKGVFSLDGKMIDAPIINRARQTVELAKLLGLI